MSQNNRAPDSNPSYTPGRDTLFIKADGSIATKCWFIESLKSLLPRTNLTEHSFRASGTTELVLRGVQLPIIKKIGRWSSDAFQRYIQTHPATMAAILTEAYSD
ncbi:15818_t:CDS:2 [Cetraspora pellucida]|uniref:15818_t:CDS:1 n=1 Tax=Cetraspora pellucida TaxID=1433469 RepID=A0ACA9KS69_9GLOM|nr:15818_t:CDS:2 [Cetraspora pellucida]